MPYIISVLLLVIVSVGFTLYSSHEQVEGASFTEETASTSPLVVGERVAEGVVAEIFETSDDDTEEENEDENNDSTPEKSESYTPPPATEETTTPTTPPAQFSTTPSAPANTYTNGTYRTSSSYRTPEGTYTMDVTVNVANDLITSAQVSFDSDGARDKYSKRFSDAYQSQVIGKDLESVSLSRVGGASLTTRAFNNALNSIRSQAS